MTNYEDTNNAVHHLRFQAALDEAVDEEAAFHAFEEHFKASAEDPYFENELKLWLTAWRKALDYFTRQAAPVSRTPTMIARVCGTDPVRELADQWRLAAEFFTSGAGLDIRETLIDCADDLEAALSQQQSAAGDEIEYRYEVWQDGMVKAGGRENDYDSAKSEANHYARMYANDGPVEIIIYEQRRVAHARRSQQREGRDNG